MRGDVASGCRSRSRSSRRAARAERRVARAARRQERALSLAYGKMLYKEMVFLARVVAASFARWVLFHEVVAQLRDWRACIRHGRARRRRAMVRAMVRGWAKLARHVTFAPHVAPATLERRGLRHKFHPEVAEMWTAPGALTSCSQCECPLAAAHGFAAATSLGRPEARPRFAQDLLWCPACRQQALAGRMMLAA